MKVRAADLEPGDCIGRFVVSIVEPFTETRRTWYGRNVDLPMVKVIGLRLIFTRAFKDEFTFMANETVNID